MAAENFLCRAGNLLKPLPVLLLEKQLLAMESNFTTSLGRTSSNEAILLFTNAGSDMSTSYERANNLLRRHDADQVLQHILKTLEDKKMYLQADLTLDSLARQLKLSAKTLSVVLNVCLGRTFHDLINEYRVAEFKQRVLNPRFRHYTLLGIAFDCGFSSKSTFNSVFKKATGATPKEYYKQCQQAA